MVSSSEEFAQQADAEALAQIIEATGARVIEQSDDDVGSFRVEYKGKPFFVHRLAHETVFRVWTHVTAEEDLTLEQMLEAANQFNVQCMLARCLILQHESGYGFAVSYDVDFADRELTADILGAAIERLMQQLDIWLLQPEGNA